MFYPIFSIIIGAFLLVFSISNIIKKEELILSIISLPFSLSFIGVAIWCFFVLGTDFEFIPMLVMLFLAVLYIALFVAFKKKDKSNTDKANIK